VKCTLYSVTVDSERKCIFFLLLGVPVVLPWVQALAVQKAAEKVAESKAKELAYIRQVRPRPNTQRLEPGAHTD